MLWVDTPMTVQMAPVSGTLTVLRAHTTTAPLLQNLPTAATIISYFSDSVGNLGLITIPCIVFYIMQVSG